MKNRIIEEIIKDAKRNINKKELSQGHIQESIRWVENFCKKVIAEKPDITAEELKRFVHNYMIEMTREFCDVASLRGLLYQYEAIDSLVDREYEIKNIYERLKLSGKKYDEDTIFTANLSKSKEIVIGQINQDDNSFKELITSVKKYLLQNSEGKRKFEKERYGEDKEKIKNFREIAEKIKRRSDIIGFYNGLLKVVREPLGEEIKDKQIEMLEFMYYFIENFDLIDEFLQKQNRNMQEFICDGIEYEGTTGCFERDNIGIRELFSKEFLKSEKMENVFAYSMFYQNRVSKICTSINSGIFAIETLGLWDSIIKGENIEITEEQQEALIKKEKCIARLTQHLLTEVKGSVKKEELQDNAYVAVDSSKKIEQYYEQEGENYQKLFEEILPNANNDLAKNIESYLVLNNQISNIYTSKDSLMEFLIRMLINSKKIKNWGVVLEENSKDEEMALIAVDYEKINMPLRLHIPKSTLISILAQYNSKKLAIPIYEGIDDFILDGKILTTNLLMPLQKRQAEGIREKIKTENPASEKYKLLEHLIFLSNDDKFPEHLKEYKGKKKGKEIYERRPKRYLDMQNGKIYIKNKNNEFEEVGDNCK